VRAV